MESGLTLTREMTMVLGLLGFTVVMFALEWVRADAVALLILVVLGITQLVNVDQLFAGFAGATFRSYELRPEPPRYLPALVVDATGADTARETQRFLQGLRDVSLARSVGGPQSAVPSRPGIQAG